MLCCAVQGSSETAAESLLTVDDASALTAAERLVQQLARHSSNGSNGALQPSEQQQAADAAAVDGRDPQQQQQQQSKAQQQSKEQQLLLGRRLLQALVGVWDDKSKNNSGKRMCFYAQELNPKLGRARGLDLHSVAARLEAGLYAATDEPMEVRPGDVGGGGGETVCFFGVKGGELPLGGGLRCSWGGWGQGP